MICIEQQQRYFDFINQKLDVAFDPKISMCICISSLNKDGEIKGVVVFDRFTKTGCEISVAAATPYFLTKQLANVVAHYAFITAGKRRVTSVVEAGNEKALRLNKGLGFVEEATLKCWFGDKDGILLRMLKEDCKWI